MGQFEYLCVEYYKFHYEIIARNIDGKFSGMAYQGIDCLVGYYGSGNPISGYDYCWWSRKHDTYENIENLDYITGDNDSCRNYCNRLD